MKKNKKVPKSYSEYFILAAVFFLALYLRLRSAFEAGTWLDEASVHVLATGYDFRHLLFINHWDAAHPPLLYLLIRLIIILCNFKFIPIIFLRIFFVFFSSLAVIPIYLITLKIVKNKFSLFVPFWYAIHPFQILMGYSVRPYGLLQFLFPVAIYAFFDESWNTKRKIVFWNILFIFLFFWDYASLWFFLPFFSWTLFKNKNRLTFVTRLLIKRLWPFFIMILGWIPLMITRATDILLLINYTNTNFVEAFLILNGTNSTWVFNNLNKNEQLFFLNLLFFLTCLIINSLRAPLFLFYCVLPLLLVTIINKFISPVLVNENLIFISIIFLIINGYFFRKQKLNNQVIYGLIFSSVLIVNFWFAYKDNNLKYPSIDLPENSLTFLSAGNYVIYSFNEYLDYVIKYNLIKSGFKQTANSVDEFYDRNVKFRIISLNLLDSYHQKLLRNTPAFLNYQRYFASYNNKYFTDTEKQIINKYCRVYDTDYRTFIDKPIVFKLCK